MSTQKLKLEVLLATINKATAPLKQITRGSTETAKALKAARDSLRALNDQQKNLDGFRKLDKDISITSNAMRGAQDRIKALKQAMTEVEKPTAAMSREFAKAVKEARSLKQEHTQLIVKQQQLRTELNGSGMDTQQLASHQRKLKTDLAAATAAVDKQTQALKKQSEIAGRINAAKRARDEGMQRRNQVAGFGAQAVGTGVVMGLPIVKMVRDFTTFEDAMLGVARQVQGAKDQNGQLTATYYEMGDEIKNLSERLPLTTVEIAQLVEGAARMGIQGKRNLLIFTEQAAIMSAAFDLPAEQIAEDMGQIRSLYKIPIDQLKELGDTVNWLDDNALSKGGDIIDVMKRIAGTADMVGMSYKDAAALGSSFLSLGATQEVAATASNAMMSRLANAPILATAKRYAGGLKMLNLEAQQLQHNMNIDATGTILDVLDRIKALPKDKQLEAATRLFGVEYGDDASKLAQNLEEYRRQLQLTKDAKAANSMQRESDTRNAALDAQADMAKSAIFNTSSQLGQLLKPALVDILQTIRSLTTGMRDWVKEHPQLVGWILKAVAIISVLTIGIGSLALGIAAILGPMVLLRFLFTMVGIKGGLLATALRFIGTAIMFIGRMFLLNPIGLLVTGIATAAFLIYKYWGPIKDWFSKLWDGITARFNKFIEPIKQALAGVKEWLGLDSSGPVLAGAGPAGASPVIKKREPLSFNGGRSLVYHDNSQKTIEIKPAPGMNEEQLAKMVAREMDKQNSDKLARNRSLMRDKE